jgi:hypothetical protein
MVSHYLWFNLPFGKELDWVTGPLKARLSKIHHPMYCLNKYQGCIFWHGYYLQWMYDSSEIGMKGQGRFCPITDPPAWAVANKRMIGQLDSRVYKCPDRLWQLFLGEKGRP